MRRPLSAVAAIAATLLLLLAAAPAHAHAEKGSAAGFLVGLRHPVSGLDHVIAMVCVGLWGAQLGPPAVWLLPVTFPLVMAFGGFLGLVEAVRQVTNSTDGTQVPDARIGLVSGFGMINYDRGLASGAALLAGERT